MKNFLFYIFISFSFTAFSQEDDAAKAIKLATKKANDLVYNANDLASNNDFVLAEMEYRKAISTQASNVAGTYNLGHSYYKKGNYDEALYRNEQTIKNATSKLEKHKAYHNIGNILMQNKKCKNAVEAFKNALRNNPNDNETRYNLGLAKECAKNEKEPPQEENDNKDKDNKENEDKQDQDKQEENEDQNKDDQKEDEGDKDKKDGDDNKDEEGKPEDEKEDEGKGDQDKKEQQKPQQQPGQLSPQQIKNLLEAMNNQEQKVQEKMNAKKAKGAKVQTDKDW